VLIEKAAFQHSRTPRRITTNETIGFVESVNFEYSQNMHGRILFAPRSRATELIDFQRAARLLFAGQATYH
jgi:hypothetical protein